MLSGSPYIKPNILFLFAPPPPPPAAEGGEGDIIVELFRARREQERALFFLFLHFFPLNIYLHYWNQYIYIL